jgi:hypothetical protein
LLMEQVKHSPPTLEDREWRYPQGSWNFLNHFRRGGGVRGLRRSRSTVSQPSHPPPDRGAAPPTTCLAVAANHRNPGGAEADDQ